MMAYRTYACTWETGLCQGLLSGGGAAMSAAAGLAHDAVARTPGHRPRRSADRPGGARGGGEALSKRHTVMGWVKAGVQQLF